MEFPGHEFPDGKIPNISLHFNSGHQNHSLTNDWDRSTSSSPMLVNDNTTERMMTANSPTAMNAWMTRGMMNNTLNTLLSAVVEKAMASAVNEALTLAANAAPISPINDTMSMEIHEVLAVDIIPKGSRMAATIGELMYVRTVTSIMMTISVAMVNMAMGAAIGKVELMRQWRVPSGIAVGSFTQFILFPLAALVIAHIFRLPSPYITGMMLVAVCPGGCMANVVSFFADGNICLCTSMILISTVVSVGYVPIVLLILSHGESAGPIGLSLWAVGIAIVIIAVPLIIGVIIRSMSETWASIITVIGIVAGLLAFTANSLVHLIIHSEIFHAPFRVYCATILLPVIGFLITLLLSCLVGQHPTSRHTLAIQAVFHNTSLAIIILTTTFSHSSVWRQLIVVPTIYGPISGVFGIIYIILYLVVTACGSDQSNEPSSGTSGYLPIDETPRGNGDYMALHGNEDEEVGLEMGSRRGCRLQINGYEEVKGTISDSTTVY